MFLLAPVAATARGRHWCRKKPVEKHGSEVTYRSVVTSASSGDPVQEFARFVTSGRRFQQKEPDMARKT